MLCALGGVLEVLGAILKALGGTLEVETSKDSPKMSKDNAKMAQERAKSEIPLELPRVRKLKMHQNSAKISLKNPRLYFFENY